MEGLVKGRIVYLVLGAGMVAAIMRRRTDGRSIAERMTAGTWPAGAQAHIGNPVTEGEVVPAMVVEVFDEQAGTVNLKAQLDGADEYWATSVHYDEAGSPGTWHWMYQGQPTRGNAK